MILKHFASINGTVSNKLSLLNMSLKKRARAVSGEE